EALTARPSKLSSLLSHRDPHASLLTPTFSQCLGLLSHPDSYWLIPTEHARRFEIFIQNLARAKKLQEEDMGTAEYGVTPFSDLLGMCFPGASPPPPTPSGGRGDGDPGSGGKCWGLGRRPQSCRSPQRSCGSCWAFAAVGNVESTWYLRAGNRLVSLSEQEVLDCGRCRDGCKGGYAEDAFITMRFNRGLASEKDYPYKVRARPNRCQANKTRAAWIHGFITLWFLPHHLTQCLAHPDLVGPHSALPSKIFLQLYVGGVMHPSHHNCNPKSSHSILLVGFGFSELGKTRGAGGKRGPREFLGPGMGREGELSGYFRLHRGSNACGIANRPVTALVRGSKRQVSCPP
uniref:Peptidase C1A papain C-terminal domain-containing protein n=1 Tax=Ornithorhynchus anatinus TaxID=9258 RepID=A0A6I8P2K0_ORNAN